MDIDLGEKPKAKVKLGASVYPMDVPTVRQAMEFKKKIDDTDENDQALVFLDLITDLGMPKSAADKLSVQQLTKLAQGLMGDAEKK